MEEKYFNLSKISVNEDTADDAFEKGLRDLEKNWFNKSELLTTDLISPFHDAAAKGNMPILRAIIAEEEIDVNLRDEAKNTALHWAAGAGHVNAVIFLIENGSDLSAQNMLGDTPLHRATWRGQLEVVRVLLEHGSDVSILNSMEKKAIDLVRDNVEVGALLQGYDLEYVESINTMMGYNFDFEYSDTSSEYDSDVDSEVSEELI